MSPCHNLACGIQMLVEKHLYSTRLRRYVTFFLLSLAFEMLLLHELYTTAPIPLLVAS